MITFIISMSKSEDSSTTVTSTDYRYKKISEFLCNKIRIEKSIKNFGSGCFRDLAHLTFQLKAKERS